MGILPTPDIDPEEILERFFDAMRARIPGWEPADPSVIVFMGEAVAEIAAQLEETAYETLAPALFRWYGTNLAGVPPIDAVPATSTVTITGTAGEDVEAGYNLALTGPDGLVGFQTTEDATLTGGSAAGVPIAANVAGEAASDLSGDVTRVDSLAYVTAVTLDAATDGGSDAEDDDAYMVRLTAEERLRSVSPILPRDFAQLAKRVLEVDRVAYLNGYDPSDGSGDNALTVTLVPVQADGDDVSPAGKTAIAAQFAEDGATPALVGFVVHVADPHESAPDVLFDFTTSPGYDPVVVGPDAEAAVADYLSRENWGQPPTGEERRFDVTTHVRRGAIFRVLYDVPGLHDVPSLSIEGSTTDDYALPVTNAEPVPITTNTGTITGTAV